MAETMTESDNKRSVRLERDALKYDGEGRFTLYGARESLLENLREDLGSAAKYGVGTKPLETLYMYAEARCVRALDAFEDTVLRAHAEFGCTSRGPGHARRYVCTDCRTADSELLAAQDAARRAVQAASAQMAAESDETPEPNAWMRDAAVRLNALITGTQRDEYSSTGSAEPRYGWRAPDDNHALTFSMIDTLMDLQENADAAQSADAAHPDVEIVIGHITVPVRVKLSDLRNLGSAP